MSLMGAAYRERMQGAGGRGQGVAIFVTVPLGGGGEQGGWMKGERRLAGWGHVHDGGSIFPSTAYECSQKTLNMFEVVDVGTIVVLTLISPQNQNCGLAVSLLFFLGRIRKLPTLPKQIPKTSFGKGGALPCQYF